MGVAGVQRHDAAPPSAARGVSLLSLDPDLGALLDDRRRAAAELELVVRVRRLRRGHWPGGELGGVTADHVGLLVVDGAMTREVVLADTISTELLGPGDLIRPWSPTRGADLLGSEIRWQVLADARLAVLGRSFGLALLRFPEIHSMLLDRLNERAERLATLRAIGHLNTVERRLIALFWHLAERWGRMTADGVVVPLTLSHRLLGELIGARRPTVSTAIAALAAEGRLTRRGDATWLLADEPEHTPAAGARRIVSHRRRLLPDLDAVEGRLHRVGRRS